MRPVLALAVLELRRFLADRFNLFFVFVLPLMLVAVLGVQSVASPSPRVALSTATASSDADDLLSRLTTQLEGAALEATAYPDRDELDEAVGEGAADLGVVVRGVDTIELELVSVGGPPPGVTQVVRAAADEVAVEQGRVETLVAAGLTPDEAEEATEGPAGREPVEVDVQRDDALGEAFDGASGFELGASGQLLLFVFLNTLGAASALIQARRSGAVRRGLAAPVTSGQTVLGLALGRLVIALFQAAWIIGMSSLLFGVRWGSLPSVLVVVTLFGLIASGSAMVVGTVMDAEGPASGVAVGAGLVLAALGGCMVPLEVFTDGLRRVAMVTPHAWAYEALAEIQRRDGGVLDVLPQLGVLAAMALAVVGLGAVLLRRSLERTL